MKGSLVTSLIIHLNSLIDSGKYQDISIQQVHSAIENKTLLQFIKSKCGNDIDLSVHSMKNLILRVNMKIKCMKCMAVMQVMNLKNGACVIKVYA
ncbi:hypothetical protein PR729_13705 [Providencia rettgeri]|nr:hypothetical protein PR729_13705 [Providencia rettgeri]